MLSMPVEAVGLKCNAGAVFMLSKTLHVVLPGSHALEIEFDMS